jgi:hypothetical protein
MSPVTYEQIIAGARAKLADNGKRIANSPHPFRWAWWPADPTFDQELLSDHSVPGPLPQVEEAFRAEIAAVSEMLGKSGHTPELARWQKGGSGPVGRMMSSLSLQADSLGLWDEIGIPIRRHGELILHIRSPRDVMGSPVVEAMHVDNYVAGVCAKTADDAATIGRLKKRIGLWRSVAGVLFILLALVVLALLT